MEPSLRYDRKNIVATAIISLYFCLSTTVFAALPQPRICTGYNPDTNDWEPVGTRAIAELESDCPEGYAFMKIIFSSGTPRPGKNLSLRGICCPLPDGVLTKEHVWRVEECPLDHVATGAKVIKQVSKINDDWRPAVKEWEKIDHYMRCTKIDTKRYQLGEPGQTIVLGFHKGFDTHFWGTSQTTEARLPVGLRFGLSREGRLKLNSGGCIGYPWGSLLTRKIHKFCGLEFRPLQYRGIDGDPPAGTLVKMFPDCLSIDDPLSTNPTCLEK